jgi:hypothetical protein
MPEQGNPDSYAQIRKEIGKIHSADATKIARLAGDVSSVIVTGPFMNGKSETLIPLLIRRFRRRGYLVEDIDCQEAEIKYPSYYEGVSNQLEQTEKGVVVLDEAGEISKLGDGYIDTVEVLKSAHERNYKVIPIVAYPAGKLDIRNLQTKVWQDAEKEVTGVEPPAYHLDALRLKSEMANRLAESMLRQYHEAVPIDSLKYIVETVPTSLGVLEMSLRLVSLYRDKPKRFLMAALMDHADRWKGFLTDEEVDQMKEKIDNDFINMVS